MEARAKPADTDIEDVLVTERELWPDGPPHELFKRLRNECPVHWTSRITDSASLGSSGVMSSGN